MYSRDCCMHNKFMELHTEIKFSKPTHPRCDEYVMGYSLFQAPRQWCSRSVKREAKTRAGLVRERVAIFSRRRPLFQIARLIFAYVLTVLSKSQAQTSHRPAPVTERNSMYVHVWIDFYPLATPGSYYTRNYTDVILKGRQV